MTSSSSSRPLKERGPDERKPSFKEVAEIIESPSPQPSPDRTVKKERSDADEPEARDRRRREGEAKLGGEPAEPPSSSSSSEEGKTEAATANSRIRRKRPTSSFKPTNTADLLELKAQLAAMKDGGEKPGKEKPPRIKYTPPSSPERESPPPLSTGAAGAAAAAAVAATTAAVAVASSKRESFDEDEDALALVRPDRGRDLDAPGLDSKQVRLVSPPREKEERKPLKGILKQPSTKFPEEPNPIREGVAPHKDDKTKQQNVPPGARWTKISRKLVNPEALTIGKERFEVRDDFVIVLRVLNKDEIEAYTAATAQLRGMLPIF